MPDELTSPEPSVQSNGTVDFSMTTRSLDQIEDMCNRVVTPHTLHSTGRNTTVDCKLNVHGSRDFGLFHIGYGASLAIQVPAIDDDDRLAILLAPSGAGQVKVEREESPLTGSRGAVLAFGPEIWLDYDEDCETLALLFSRRKISEHLARILGREIAQPIAFQMELSLDTPSGSSFQRLIQYAADELRQPHSLTRQLPTVRQQLEQLVISTLLLSQPHSFSSLLLQPQSAAAPFYVKKAEAYIEAHFAEALSLADIAAHAGVSVRSLQNGFQNFRKMTPMAFLRSVRLQRCRQALLRADPAVSTVTQIAMSCGFSHLGEFAAHYGRMFGETPKQTLFRTSYL